jgi:hypothetical protein
MIFNFLSKSVNTEKKPNCPKCGRNRIDRQVSMFAAVGDAKEPGKEDLPFDEAKMERAMESLASEAGSVDEDNPRDAANMIRKFTDMTGMKLGGPMEEALRRMEAGEDPEAIEAEMGDVLENEDPFAMTGDGAKSGARLTPPGRDETLYEL